MKSIKITNKNIKYGIRSKNFQLGEYLIFHSYENVNLNIGEENDEILISMYSGGSNYESYKRFSYSIRNSKVVLVDEKEDFTTYKIKGNITYLSKWDFENATGITNTKK